MVHIELYQPAGQAACYPAGSSIPPALRHSCMNDFISTPSTEAVVPSVDTPISPIAPVAAFATPHPVQAARALLKKLQQDFPSFRECLPLAIGIDKQLIARQPDLSRKLLRIALGQHTNSLRYLKALEKATHRFDLDGKPGEPLTDEHRKHAATTLRERFKKQIKIGRHVNALITYPAMLVCDSPLLDN